MSSDEALPNGWEVRPLADIAEKFDGKRDGANLLSRSTPLAFQASGKF